MRDESLTEGGRLYVGAVIAAGIVAVSHSIYVIHLHPVSYHWAILAGLTLLTGSFTVRIPTIPARLSVSETFVFAAVLLFGPAAATMIVVLDSLVISLWQKRRSRRASRVLFNVAAPSVAIWLAAHGFYGIAGIEPLALSPQPVLPLLGSILVLAILYFLLNSALVAWAVAFEKNVSAFLVWRESFLWLSLNYFSGASVAALLLPYLQPEKPEFARVIGILLPLLLISYLTFKTAMGRVDDAHRHLKELNRLYLSTIETLAMAIDAKDQITHGHIRRVQIHAVGLARAMGVKESAQISAIEAAALLHDMGKLAVPEYILNKPGPLTAAEFERMKMHASIGADILSAIDFPYPVVPIVRHHHESWDGTGYPDRLAGAAIPIGARILSVVDCFDALTSDRPYRPRLSDKEALRILGERRGRMYDPLVVDTFIKLHGEGGLGNIALVADSPFSTFTSSSLPTRPHHARPLENISASGEEMLVLFELARSMSDRVGFIEVGELVVKHLRRIVPSSLFVFYSYDSDSDELISTYAAGESSSIVGDLRIPLGQRLTGWVGAHKQTIRNSDPILDLGDSVRSVSPRLRSCLSTPLVVGNSLIGVLSLYSSLGEAFSDDHQRIIEVVARQIAPALHQGASADQKQQSSGEEPLVRGQLEEFIASQTSAAGPLAIILINLVRADTAQDRVRDSESVEAQLTRSIRKQIPPTDILFRLQESEFLVIQFHADAVVASATSKRIRQAIDAQLRESASPPIFTLRISVAQMPGDGETVSDLITVAKVRIGSPSGRPLGNAGQPPESIH